MEEVKLPQIFDEGQVIDRRPEDEVYMSMTARASTAPAGSPGRGRLASRGKMATYKLNNKAAQWENARPVRPGGPGGKKKSSKTLSSGGPSDIELNVMAMEKLLMTDGEFDPNESFASTDDQAVLLKQQNTALKKKCAQQADMLANVITELRLEKQLASHRADEFGKLGEKASRTENDMHEASVTLKGKDTLLVQTKKKLARAKRDIKHFEDDFTAMKMEKADLISKHQLEMKEMKATNENLQQTIRELKASDANKRNEGLGAIVEGRDALAKSQANEAILTRRIVEVEEARTKDKVVMEEKIKQSWIAKTVRQTAEKNALLAICQVPTEDPRALIATLEGELESLSVQYQEMAEAKERAHKNFQAVSNDNAKLSQELRSMLSVFNSRFSSLISVPKSDLAQGSNATAPPPRPQAPTKKKKGMGRKKPGQAGRGRMATSKSMSDAGVFRSLVEKTVGPMTMTELQAMLVTQSKLVMELSAEKGILTSQLQHKPNGPSVSFASGTVGHDEWSMGINIKQIYDGRRDGRLLDGVARGDNYLYSFSVTDRNGTIDINTVDKGGHSLDQKTYLSLTDDAILSLFPGHHTILQNRGHHLAMSIVQRLVYKSTPAPLLELPAKENKTQSDKMFQQRIQRNDTFKVDPINDTAGGKSNKNSVASRRPTQFARKPAPKDVEEGPTEEDSAVKLQAVIRGRQSRDSGTKSEEITPGMASFLSSQRPDVIDPNMTLVKKGGQKIGNVYALISMYFEEVPKQNVFFVYQLVEEGSVTRDTLEVRVPLIEIAGMKN
jgi:hypothetical protein